jgi:hypothetical protein
MRSGWHFYVIKAAESGAIIGLGEIAQCDAGQCFAMGDFPAIFE